MQESLKLIHPQTHLTVIAAYRFSCYTTHLKTKKQTENKQTNANLGSTKKPY